MNNKHPQINIVFDRRKIATPSVGPWIEVLSLVIFNKMTREQFAYYIYAFPTTTCGPLMMLGMFW